MKIVGYETTAVRVPYEKAITGSHVILQLKTDAGIEGLSFVSRLGAGALQPLTSVLRGYLDQILGLDPLNIEAIYARLFRRPVVCRDSSNALPAPSMLLSGTSRPRLPASPSTSCSVASVVVSPAMPVGESSPAKTSRTCLKAPASC